MNTMNFSSPIKSTTLFGGSMQYPHNPAASSSSSSVAIGGSMIQESPESSSHNHSSQFGSHHLQQQQQPKHLFMSPPPSQSTSAPASLVAATLFGGSAERSGSGMRGNLLSTPSSYVAAAATAHLNSSSASRHHPQQQQQQQQQQHHLSATRSPPSSQFKTPQKYQDRFIPARTDSISKTLFDLKDESSAMDEELNTTAASNSANCPIGSAGISGGIAGTAGITSGGASSSMSAANGAGTGTTSAVATNQFLIDQLGMPSISSTGASIASMMSGGGGRVSTPSSMLTFSTPSKKKTLLFQPDENSKSYSEFMQKELFGTNSSDAATTSILKFNCDQSSKSLAGSTSGSAVVTSAAGYMSPMIHHRHFASTSPFIMQASSTPDRNPKDEKRKISKTPFKVLDAPGLQDDFYIDLLDWSAKNEIAVGLGKSIFIWNAGTGTVAKLCENTLSPLADSSASESLEESQQRLAQSQFTSLKWSPNGTHMAIGNQSGKVDLWDVQAHKIVRSFHRQTERIGSLDFNNSNVFAAGSKDKSILIQDIRDSRTLKMAIGHKQEVCQVRWSPDQQYLASGGNDNAVLIWNFNRSAQDASSQNSSNSNYSNGNRMSPYQRNGEHKAAVRALAWNPHQYGILLSGGGSRDQTIKVWNVNTNSVVSSVDVGSQVCKLQFSPDHNEFVAAHGFEYNRITVWKYPSLQQIAELEGHQNRVLFMSLSPDAQNIVTGAGDETLKLWKVFQGKPPVQPSQLSQLSDLR